METRLLIAYGLIAVLASGGIVWGAVARTRRRARRLRLRGIKVDQSRGQRGGEAARSRQFG